MKPIPRSDVPEEQKWNSQALFSGWDEIDAEMKSLESEFPKLSAFEGQFSTGANVVAEYLAHYQMIFKRISLLEIYLSMAINVDMSDERAKSTNGQLGGTMAKFQAASAFAEPEMVAMIDTLLAWSISQPKLKIYQQYFERLSQKADHTRSKEVEEVLGLLSEPFGGALRTWQELNHADLQYAEIIDETGQPNPYQQVANGMSPSRDLRRQTWVNGAEARLTYKNTLASNYLTSVQQNNVLAKVKRYDSVLQMRMEPTGLPTYIFHHLIDAFKDNLGTWHRYWDVKRRLLGFDKIHPYDIWAPVVDNPPDIPFEQSVAWICAALQPLGEEYVSIMRKGCLEDRWVDRSYNLNKPTKLAFSSPSFDGSPPYIMIPYRNKMLAMSILSHELGHSMNYYLVGMNQPPIYNQTPSESVLETPSNFHQAMTRAYLHQLKANDEPFIIGLIEEAMFNFHRYFFYMPTIARFEHEVHQRVMDGKPVNATILNGMMGGFLAEGYGSTMTFEADYAGITWSELIHVYMPFYSFQYAIGISAAHAIVDEVLAGKEGATEKYLEFASLGTSLDALDSFDVAGVDMRTREPIDKAFALLADLVDQLEALVS